MNKIENIMFSFLATVFFEFFFWKRPKFIKILESSKKLDKGKMWKTQQERPTDVYKIEKGDNLHSSQLHKLPQPLTLIQRNVIDYERLWLGKKLVSTSSIDGQWSGYPIRHIGRWAIVNQCRCQWQRFTRKSTRRPIKRINLM